MMSFRKHKFLEGCDEAKKEEVTPEGITVTTRYCKICGEVSYESAEKTEEKAHPIYMCTAPFGVLSRDFSGNLSGESSGVLTFNSGSLRGSFDSKLEETYVVKYLDGNRLKTKTFEAEKTDIIIDGRFCLTHPVEISYKKKDGKWVERYRYDKDYYMELHLPELPKLSQATTQSVHFTELSSNKSCAEAQP